MSYCVNCGVELHDSAKKCPLCDTPVINPASANKEDTHPGAYPENIVLPPANGRRYAAFIASIILLIPNVICFSINMIDTVTNGTWFVYITSSCILLWTVCILPLLPKKPNPYVCLLIDYLVFQMFSMFICAIAINDKNFGVAVYAKFLLPASSVLAAVLMFLIAFLRKKRQLLEKAIAIVFCVAIVGGLTFLLVINTFSPGNKIVLPVEICIITSALALNIFFIAVMKNKRLKAWVTRRFFI